VRGRAEGREFFERGGREERERSEREREESKTHPPGLSVLAAGLAGDLRAGSAPPRDRSARVEAICGALRRGMRARSACVIGRGKVFRRARGVGFCVESEWE
jgi:hypothetical protein